MLEMRRSQLESLPQITEGGEAIIYAHGRNEVIKAFKPNVNLGNKEKKVAKFLTARFPANVAKPLQMLMVNGRFAGYVMQRIDGAEDFHQFTKKKFLATSGFSNKDIAELVWQASVSIKSLHENGILIGDISDNNLVAVGKNPFFIDVDSWGVQGMFSPDAYTELFTCPDSYAPNGSICFSLDSENYNFAVLAFNMLTRIHPFFGVHDKAPNMSPAERMKRRISILGKEKEHIKIPKIIPSWKWISPDLEQTFIDIFENGKRVDISDLLGDLVGNMKYCKQHDIHYYGKYKECPLCNTTATVITAPVVVVAQKPTSGGPRISVYFAAQDCKFILGLHQYLSTNGEVVYFEPTNPSLTRRIPLSYGKKIDFSDDGKYAFISTDEQTQIVDKSGKVISSIDRYFKSSYSIRGNEFFYVDKGSNVIKLAITDRGNVAQSFGKQYNPLFDIADNGEVFIASMYPKKAIIYANHYNFEVLYDGKIKEYAIKYDPVSKCWLFVYQLANGKYRTMVFGDKKVLYDDDVLTYNATPLSGICFYGNTIYDPANGKFIGVNPHTNKAKDFACDVVTESSKLEFTGRGFRIYNDDKIYNFS